MKFTVKSMVLAAMLVAGSANAAPIVNVNTTTGSDLFLVAYDYSNKFSAVFDLGNKWSFSDIANGTAVSDSYSVAADASWVSFTGAATSANVKWAVFAGQKSTATATSATVLLETVAAGAIPTAGSAYKQATVAAANVNNTNFLTTAATNGLTQGGSIFTQGTTNAPFVGTSLFLGATGKFAGAGTTIVNSLDTFATLATYTAASNGPTGSTLTVFDPTVGFKLSSAGVLTYTALPVPETDTYAMLLAGLGVMGLVARRRLAA